MSPPARITVDDQPIAGRSPWAFSTHFNFRHLKRYQFTVGKDEQHQVVIEHERSLLWAGLRRQKYRVYVDGQAVQEHYGF
jgi:hypothetical protein